jgi:hypothetical protein
VESPPGWFNELIYKFILLHHTSANRIGHATWSPSFDAPGDHHPDVRMVTDACVDGTKPRNKRPIFSGRKKRHPADRAKQGCSDSDAGTGVFPMARPRVRRIRQEDGFDLVKQPPVSYLASIILMQM